MIKSNYKELSAAELDSEIEWVKNILFLSERALKSTPVLQDQVDRLQVDIETMEAHRKTLKPGKRNTTDAPGMDV